MSLPCGLVLSSRKAEGRGTNSRHEGRCQWMLHPMMPYWTVARVQDTSIKWSFFIDPGTPSAHSNIEPCETTGQIDGALMESLRFWSPSLSLPSFSIGLDASKPSSVEFSKSDSVSHLHWTLWPGCLCKPSLIHHRYFELLLYRYKSCRPYYRSNWCRQTPQFFVITGVISNAVGALEYSRKKWMDNIPSLK